MASTLIHLMNVPSPLVVRIAAIAIVVQTLFCGLPARAQSDWETWRTWPPGIDPAGNATGGFTLSLVRLDGNATTGRAWEVRLAVRNVSTAVKEIAFEGMGCNYSFAFRDEASGATHSVRPRSCEVYNPEPMTLPPGRAAYLEVAVSPDETGALRPGAVSIMARCDIHVMGRTTSEVHLTSNAVPLTVVAGDGRPGPGSVFDDDAYYLGLSTTAAAGPTVGGIALSVTPDAPSMPAGSAWSAVLEVRNVSAEQQDVAGPITPCQFNFIFRNRLSQAVNTASPEDDCDVYWVGKIHIPPGRSAFLRATLRSDDINFLRVGATFVWTRANLPEDYERGTPSRIVTSNGLLLRVLSPEATPSASRESRCARAPHT